MQTHDVIEVMEYEAIFCSGFGRNIDKKTFKELEHVMLELSQEGRDGLDFLSLSSRKGIGKVIRAKNYVGVLQMPSGRQLQILPKIHTSNVDARIVMLKMLKTFREFPSKSFDATELGSSKMPMFDIYISLFLREVSHIVKRGLKSDYRKKEENVRFYKGKMNFARQLTINHVHKEQFFVAFDDYSIDCPENRILKKALMKAMMVASDPRNRREARRLLQYFDHVEESHTIDQEFKNILENRKNRQYTTSLEWSRLLLNDLNISNMVGNTRAQSLLFSMNQLFESYVGNLIERHSGTRWEVSLKNPVKSLFDRGSFRLVPDVVMNYICPIDNVKKTRIIDMKWKVLNPNIKNLGISQADMYQMFAYAKKYASEQVIVVYPLVESFAVNQRVFRYTSEDITVFIYLLDCVNGEKELLRFLDNPEDHQCKSDRLGDPIIRG